MGNTHGSDEVLAKFAWAQRGTARPIVVVAPLLAALFALVPGCSSEATSEPAGGDTGSVPEGLRELVVGSRLQPRFLDGGDGAKVLADFYDSELDTLCTFERTIDGQLLCLPGTKPGHGLDGSDGYYADANCTQRAVEIDPCGAGPLIAVRSRVRCTYGTVTGVLEADADAEAIAGYFLTEDGSCISQGSERAFLPAKEVPLSQFAATHTENVAVGAGLGVQRLIAEDGTQLNLALLRGDALCGAADVAGQLRCVDTRQAHPNAFADASCAEPAANYAVCDYEQLPGGVVTSETPTLMFQSNESPSGCALEGRFFSVGDPVETPYFFSGNTCYEDPSLSEHERVLHIKGELPVAELPALEVISSGTGRLRALRFGAAGVPLVPSTRWFDPGANRDPRLDATTFYDTELEIECQPMLTEGGDVRCLPPFREGSAFFSDGSCTQYLIGDYGPCYSGQEFRGEVTENRCAVTEMHQRTERYTGPLFGGGEGCLVLGAASEASIPGVYRSKAIVLEDFALLQVVR